MYVVDESGLLCIPISGTDLLSTNSNFNTSSSSLTCTFNSITGNGIMSLSFNEALYVPGGY